MIEELQSNRSQMVHLFDSLARTIPDGVVLTTIKQEGNSLTLQGRSQLNVRVSTYMRNIEGSGWMTNPDLSIIEAKEQDKNTLIDSRALPYVFTIKAKLSSQSRQMRLVIGPYLLILGKPLHHHLLILSRCQRTIDE